MPVVTPADVRVKLQLGELVVMNCVAQTQLEEAAAKIKELEAKLVEAEKPADAVA